MGRKRDVGGGEGIVVMSWGRCDVQEGRLGDGIKGGQGKDRWRGLG